MNPVEHAREPEGVAHYKVEPYVVVADIYNLAGQEGRGGWSWYTGSAGWMYRVWVEEALGLQKRGDTLTLDPSIPAAWNGFTLRYRHGSALYVIQRREPANTFSMAWAAWNWTARVWTTRYSVCWMTAKNTPCGLCSERVRPPPPSPLFRRLPEMTSRKALTSRSRKPSSHRKAQRRLGKGKFALQKHLSQTLSMVRT